MQDHDLCVLIVYCQELDICMVHNYRTQSSSFYPMYFMVFLTLGGKIDQGCDCAVHVIESIVTKL